MTRESFKNFLFSIGIESEQEQNDLCEKARELFRGEALEEVKDFSTSFYNQKNINGVSYVPVSYLLTELKRMNEPKKQVA